MSVVLIADDQASQIVAGVSLALPEATLLQESQAALVCDRVAAHPEIDVVLLDLCFDGQTMQGLDVLEALQDQFPNLPILVFSQEDDPDLSSDLVREKNVVYVGKKGGDFNVRRFQFLMRGAIAESRQFKSLPFQKLAFSPAHELKVTIGPHELTLDNRAFALYRTSAEALLRGWPGVGPLGIGDHGWIKNPDLCVPGSVPGRFFLEVYRETYRNEIDQANELRVFMMGDEVGAQQALSQSRSRLGRKLKKVVTDERLLSKFEIKSRRVDPPNERQFWISGLSCDAKDISIT